MKFILSIILSVLLFACSKKAGEKTSLKLKMPTRAELTSSNYESQRIKGVKNLTSLGEITCFAVFVEAPEEVPLGQCYDSSSSEVVSKPAFHRGYVDLGGDIEIEVSSGLGRNIQILAVNSDLGCFGLEEYTGPFSTKTSNPLIMGEKRVDIEPGEQEVTIDISLRDAKELSYCDFFTSGGGHEVTNVVVENDQIKIYGNFNTVDKVILEGNTLDIINQSATEIIASSTQALSIPLNNILNLIIEPANSAPAISVQFNLVDGSITSQKLSDMGAVAGDVLQYDGLNWTPTSMSGLNLLGGWNASTNPLGLSDGVGSGGDYYIVTTAGTTDFGNGPITFAVGDWAAYSDSTSTWFKVPNGGGVLSFNSRTGAITPAVGDYSWAQIDKAASLIGDISDVDTSGASIGNILEFDGSQWVAGTAAGGGDFYANGSVSMTGNLDMGSNNLINVNQINGFSTSDFVLKTTLINGLPLTTNITLDTDDIAEATNLYHTVARARAAAVVNSTAGSETDQAPSVSSMKSYVAAQTGGYGDFQSTGSVAMTGNLDMGGNAVTNVGNVDGVDVSAFHALLTSGSANQFFRGDQSWVDIGDTILSSYAVGIDAAVTNSDSILSAFGKLQAQINASGDNSSATDVIIHADSDANDTGNLILRSGSTDVLVIDPTTERVGINRASPSFQLDVESGANVAISARANTGGQSPAGIQIQNTSTASAGWVIGENGNQNFTFKRNGESASFFIKPTGEVAIGTQTPTALFELYKIGVDVLANFRGDQSGGITGIKIKNDFHAGQGWLLGQAGDGMLKFVAPDTSTIAVEVQPDGLFRTVQGHDNPSDIRYKKSIKELNGSLQKIIRLNGVSYYWRHDEFEKFSSKKSKDIGLIAQEVKEVFPEVVNEDSKGFLGLSYHKLIAPLIEAFKEFYISFVNSKEDHESRILELEAENKVLRESLCEIKSDLKICRE